MKKFVNCVIVGIILINTSCSMRSVDSREEPYAIQVDSILRLMTLEEKLGQLNLPSSGDISTGLAKNTGIVTKIRDGRVGGLFNIRGLDKIRAAQQVAIEESRLGIPLLFGMDVIHGYKTVFPIPLGLSCSWDMDLVENSARIAAREATSDGIMWTFSPMVDISRDPRWGRMAEGAGEDAFLGSQIAAAMVKGYQGENLSDKSTMMACLKHFALYGASEAGRDYGTVDMSRLRMYNEYLPPYKAAIDAGAGSVMASFNEIDGIPATGNKWLLTELLRKEWGFEGFVVSDYTGVTEMIDHGMGDSLQVASLAINAGNDMDMVSEAMINYLEKAIDSGIVDIEKINQSCRKILQAKYKLGLFEDPFKYCEENRSSTEIYTADHRNQARKTASESFVLLKNENEILPLQKRGTLALIGPMADNALNMQGTWSVSGDHKTSITLLEGIKEVAGGQVKILTAKGTNFVGDEALEKRISAFGKDTKRDNRSDSKMIREAVQIAMKSDVIVAAIGEASESSGESSSRTNIEIPENQRMLLKALLKTGKPVIAVVFAGRPLALNWENDNVPAILNVWFPGSEGGLAIADVLFGDVNPSGKLSVCFPRNEGQIPIFYNHKNTGRPLASGKWFQKFRSNYLDVPNDPLYPFGFGLSYTQFEYSNIKLNEKSLEGSDTLEVSVEISNTGDRVGKEIVQLYIRDLVGSITRPVKELKGFKKVQIEAGTSKTIKFQVTNEDLKFYNSELKYVWEPGEFHIMVGSNSKDLLYESVNWTNKTESAL